MDEIITIEFLRIFFKKSLEVIIEGLYTKSDSVILRFNMQSSGSNVRRIEIEVNKEFYEQHKSEFYIALSDSGCPYSPYKPLRDNQKGFPKL